MKNKKVTSIVSGLILLLVVLGVYYYVTLPAINIHCKGFWTSIIFLLVAATIIFGFLRLRTVNIFKGHKRDQIDPSQLKHAFDSKAFKLFFTLTILVILIYGVGYLLSSPIINAKKYRELITIQNSSFTDDIKQISYNEIPSLDKESAQLLGTRKMGNMVEYVSQFEVSDDYTQINYKDSPVRVSPLEYGNVFKWFSNASSGIPAYIRIDMATQNVECVKLEQGMKYTKSDHFGRNIYRYIRFKFPTYIFDELSFEIDDNGTPYWICPVKDYTIGLFGGETIRNAVLVNAVTGETTDYPIDQVPSWVDHVFSADLLISYYNYNGTLINGYINSLFSQKGCLKTTDGYNYIALNDDVWVYTGVTSVGQDASNVGFVLMNQRTAETKYYSIAGAEEHSAMESAEGKVQQMQYKATFPLLLNIAGEPTYFIALKDGAGLVKQYAMVNISKYTIVSIGDSITECEKSYRNLLKSNNITNDSSGGDKEKTGIISKMVNTVIEGNSHYYVMFEGDEAIYDFNLNDMITIIKYNVGDSIKISYTEGTTYNVVHSISE
ncbi:MAG: CvpA family protein [bacterium]|nr:CvpA family protein [bacterium]